MLSAHKFVRQKQPHPEYPAGRRLLSTGSTRGQHGSDANMPAKSMHLPSFAGKFQKSETPPFGYFIHQLCKELHTAASRTNTPNHLLIFSWGLCSPGLSPLQEISFVFTEGIVQQHVNTVGMTVSSSRRGGEGEPTSLVHTLDLLPVLGQ